MWSYIREFFSWLCPLRTHAEPELPKPVKQVDKEVLLEEFDKCTRVLEILEAQREDETDPVERKKLSRRIAATRRTCTKLYEKVF
jgi:hypothetical protein